MKVFRKMCAGLTLLSGLLVTHISQAAAPTVISTYSVMQVDYLGSSDTIPDLIIKNTKTRVSEVYIPIPSLVGLLKGHTLTSIWNTQKLALDEPSEDKVAINWGTPKPGKSPFKLYANGHLVETVTPLVHYDPQLHKTTTYLNINSMGVLMKYLYFWSDWDGHLWNIQPYPTQWSLAFYLNELDNNGYGGLIDDKNPQDPITLSMVDQALFANWDNGAYTENNQDYPGKNVADWATIIGLNVGVTNTSYLTPPDFEKVQQNYLNIAKGTVAVPTNPYNSYESYKVLYPLNGIYRSNISVSNEFITYFNTSFNLKTALDEAYSYFDRVTVQQYFPDSDNKEKTVVILSIPTFPLNGPWKVQSDLIPGTTYSLDNGKTWKTPIGPTYDSSNPKEGGLLKPPARVLVKIPSVIITNPNDFDKDNQGGLVLSENVNGHYFGTFAIRFYSTDYGLYAYNSFGGTGANALPDRLY